MSCAFPNAEEHIARKNDERANMKLQESTLAYRAIVEKGIDQVVNALNNAFPHVSFILTTTGDPAMIGNDGNVYINKTKFNPMAPIHELGHIFLAIAITGSDIELKRSAEEIHKLAQTHIDNKSDLYFRVKSRYPSSLSGTALRHEIANFILTERLFEEPGTNTAKSVQMGAVRRFWNNIFKKILGFLGAYDNNQLDSIRGESIYTLANVFDRFAYDWLNGSVKSDMTRGQLIKFLDMLDAHSLSFASQNEKAVSWKDIDRVLMRHENHESVNKAILIQRYTNRIASFIPMGKGTLKEYGYVENVDFTGMSTEQRVDYIKNVATRMAEHTITKQIDLKNNYIKFLNRSDAIGELNKMTDQQFDALFFKTTTKRDLRRALIHMGFTTTGSKKIGEAMPLSEAIRKYPSSFAGIDENSIGQDPVVIIHREMTKGQTTVGHDISLINITFNDFNSGTNNYKGQYLFGERVPDTKQAGYDFRIKANYGGLTQFQMGMQALKIMKQNPGNNIRRCGLIQVGRNIVPGFMDLNKFKREVASLRNLENNSPERFLDVLPDDMASLIRDPDTDKIKTDDEIFHVLLNFMYANMDELEESRSPKQLRTMIEIIEKFLTDPGDFDNLKYVLEKRKLYLTLLKEKNNPMSFQQQSESEELRLIGQALTLLRSRSKKSSNPLDQFGELSFLFTPMQDLPSDILQTLIHVLRTSENQVQGMVDNKYRPIAAMLKKNYNVQVLSQNAKTVFEKLFIHYDEVSQRLEDEHGNLITNDTRKGYEKRRIMTGRIACTKEDMDMLNNSAYRKANPNLKLTPEDIEIGKAIADVIDKAVRDFFYHQELSNPDVYTFNKESGFSELDEKKIMEIVDSKYRDHWEYGRIPILGKTTAELVTGESPSFRKALKSFVKKVGNETANMNEALGMFKEDYRTGNVPSIFARQIHSDADRLRLIGVTLRSGSNNIYDGPKNESFEATYNLENIVQYFLSDIYGKIVHEEESMPAYDDFRLAVLDNVLRKNVDQGTVNKGGTFVTERHVLQKQHYMLGESKSSKRIEKSIRTHIAMNNIFMTSMSVPIAVISTTSNNVQAFANAISNKMAGDPHKIFSLENFMQAKAEMIKNFRKVDALMSMYQVWDRDISTYLNDPRFKAIMKDPYKSRIPQYLNWVSDYMARAEVMVAQMIYDGSYDAHQLDKNGNLVYDAKKDKRFFTNGKQSDEQRVLMDSYTKNLTKDRRVNQVPGELPVRGYDLEDQGRFSWLAKEFVIGAMGKFERSIGNELLLVKAFNNFKMFLNVLVDNRLGQLKEMQEGGYKVVRRDEAGNLKVEWENFRREGSWRTVGKYIVNGTGFARGMQLLDTAGKPMTPGKWGAMTKEQKFAFYRTSADVIAICMGLLLTTIISSLAGDDDDEKTRRKKENAMRHSRLVRMFTDGFLTTAAITPFQLGKTMGLDGSVFPVVGMYKSLINVVSFDAKPSDVKRFIPGRGTYESVTEVSDLFNE
jgi:hypothetical protein